MTGSTPLHQVRSRWLLLSAGLLAAGLSWISLRAFPALPLQNDSISYFEYALHFRGLDSQASLFYPPGYPLFLAFLSRGWSSSFGRDLLLIQHSLRLLPLVLFAVLAMRQPKSLLPGAAAVLFAIAPENLVFAHYLMSESLALGLASLAGIAYLMLWQRPGLGRAAAAGGITALLTMVRPAGAIFLVAAALVPGRRRRLCFSSGSFSVAAAVCAAVLAISVVYNAVIFGAPALTNSAGRHLFNRVVADDGCFKRGDADLARLESLRGAGAGETPTYWWNYLPMLYGMGFSESQADRLLLRIALRGVMSDPICYVAGTLRGGTALLFWRPAPPAGASSYRALEHELAILDSEAKAAAFWQRRIPDKKSLLRVLMELDPFFRADSGQSWLRRWTAAWQGAISAVGILPALLVGAGIAWACASGGAPGLLMCLLLVPGVLAHAAMEMAVPRYGLPFQPFTFYLFWAGLGGAGLLLERLGGLWRRSGGKRAGRRGARR